MSSSSSVKIAIIGGGLAGTECALTLARFGISSCLFEQKPEHMSPAHQLQDLGELVCSNSLRSNELSSGIGLLKQEMRELDSPFMRHADASAVPAGKALAVDREVFAKNITEEVLACPLITVHRQQIQSLEDTALQEFTHVVLAAGPLASDSLAASLSEAVGGGQLYFYDAIAPIVSADSLDRSIVFRGSRYQEPEDAALTGEYLNCPMEKDEYLAFYEALLEGDKVQAKDFEKEIHFEGCMPIEALAERGARTLTFGPLKPVGFVDPRTGRRPYAIIQLRTENLNESMYNLVGCQTKLTYGAQQKIFRMIPGLEQAEFVRFGSMHRNTYVNAPKVLEENLCLKGYTAKNVRLAGQITGVEGYVESAACGLWAALTLVAELQDKKLMAPPVTSALGALMQHLRTEVKKFQPSNAHFGLMPELGVRAKKAERKVMYASRARESFAMWLQEHKEQGFV